MRAVIKKELADHFGSTRFLIIMSLVFMVSFLSAHLAGQGVKEALSSGGGEVLEGRTFLLLFTASASFLSLTNFLTFFGPLVGIILGFDAINRERNQGTLSKVLSQPIYRDELILGKYLAGLITITIMLTSLMLLLTGLGLMGVGVVPTGDEVLRLIIFWFISILYVGFWLGLSIIFSIVFRSVATSALATAALWILISFFLPVFGQVAATFLTPVVDPANPSAEELASFNKTNKIMVMASPTGLYNQASATILDPTHRGSNQSLQMALMSRKDQYLLNRFQGGLSTPQSFLLIMPDLLLLFGFMVCTYLISYLLFVRMEVRSA